MQNAVLAESHSYNVYCRIRRARLDTRDTLVRLSHVENHAARLDIFHKRSDGNFEDDIRAVLAELFAPASVLSVLSKITPLIAKIEQRAHAFISNDDDITAAASVTSVRSACGDIFSLRKEIAPSPPLPALTKIFTRSINTVLLLPVSKNVP